MERIGVFTPEQARLLWQDYQQRMRSGPPRPPIYQDTSPHRVFVKNDAGEQIPPFGCMEIMGVELHGEQTVLTVTKPETETGDYLMNSQFEIEAGEAGWAYRFGIVIMLGDEPDADAKGWHYKPVIDSWEVEPGPGPFLVYGRHDVNDRALIGKLQEWPDVTVVLDETAAAAADPLAASQPTYTASIFRETATGALEDTGEKLEVVNRYEHIDLAQYTLAVARRINREWRLISADCSALSDWPL